MDDRVVSYEPSGKILRKFMRSNEFVRGIMGPLGCIEGLTKIFTERGLIPISEITRTMRVLSWNQRTRRYQLSLCGKSFLKGRDYLYRVSTGRGEFVAAGFHRVFCGVSYKRVDELNVGDELLTSPSSVLNLRRIVLSYQDRCGALFRQYGRQLRSFLRSSAIFSPLLTCAQTLSRPFGSFCFFGFRGSHLPERNHRDQFFYRARTYGSYHLFESLKIGGEDRVYLRPFSRICPIDLTSLRSLLTRSVRRIKKLSSLYLSLSTSKRILSIQRETVKKGYWDIQVLDTNNYITVDGTIHHNSGKSTSCAIEILRRAQKQTPSPDGVRRTRWAIIRNSYPELKSTTMKTWGDWCPLTFGKLNQDSPITHHIKTKDIDMEVLFLALDRDDDVRKLLSLELTGAWVNEAREVPKAIIDALTGRVGRYPSRTAGGCTWSGIIMDTNPPDDQSWWYELAENDTPDEWVFFRQPPGTHEQAENVDNLPEGYYRRLSGGKDPDWLKVYVDGEYGFVTEGKAVFQQYRDSFHAAKEKLQANENIDLMIGVDFGLTPAAIIGQKLVDGRWMILDELVADDCGVIRFAEHLSAYIAKNYHWCRKPVGWGDPSGGYRSDTDEKTALAIMKEYTNWSWKPAPSNDLTMRLEVVKSALNRVVDGKPGLHLSPNVKTLRKGFAGGYHYRFVKTGSAGVLHEKPNKNWASHPHDALQYLLLGGGEHHVVMRKNIRDHKSGPRFAKGLDYKIFG